MLWLMILKAQPRLEAVGLQGERVLQISTSTCKEKDICLMVVLPFGRRLAEVSWVRVNPWHADVMRPCALFLPKSQTVTGRIHHEWRYTLKTFRITSFKTVESSRPRLMDTKTARAG